MAKQVIRLNESDLARMIDEAVNKLKKEGKSYKRGDDKCDGHKTKMKPYKEPKYRDFNFDEEEDEVIVNENIKKEKLSFNRQDDFGSNQAHHKGLYP